MRLHGDVGVEMVQSTVSLFATVPATFVHALNLFISSSRTLMLLRAGDGHERVNLLNIKFALANARRSFMIYSSQSPFSFSPFCPRVSRRIMFFFSLLFFLLSRLQTRATPLSRAKITAAPLRLQRRGLTRISFIFSSLIDSLILIFFLFFSIFQWIP